MSIKDKVARITQLRCDSGLRLSRNAIVGENYAAIYGVECYSPNGGLYEGGYKETQNGLTLSIPEQYLRKGWGEIDVNIEGVPRIAEQLNFNAEILGYNCEMRLICEDGRNKCRWRGNPAADGKNWQSWDNLKWLPGKYATAEYLGEFNSKHKYKVSVPIRSVQLVEKGDVITIYVDNKHISFGPYKVKEGRLDKNTGLVTFEKNIEFILLVEIDVLEERYKCDLDEILIAVDSVGPLYTIPLTNY